jgi:hypothetical protein
MPVLPDPLPSPLSDAELVLVKKLRREEKLTNKIAEINARYQGIIKNKEDLRDAEITAARENADKDL